MAQYLVVPITRPTFEIVAEFSDISVRGEGGLAQREPINCYRFLIFLTIYNRVFNYFAKFQCYDFGSVKSIRCFYEYSVYSSFFPQNLFKAYDIRGDVTLFYR